MTGEARKLGAIGSMGELLVEFVYTEKDGHNLRASTYAGSYASGAPGIVAQAIGGLVDPMPTGADLPDRIVRRMAGDVVWKYRAVAGE